jgi:hypothetical protein
MELTECEGLAASAFGRRLAGSLSPTPAVSTHRRWRRRRSSGGFPRHGSRTRGLVAGMGTPGGGGAAVAGSRVTGRGRVDWWRAWARRATAASAARAGSRSRAATWARGSATASRGGGACRRRWATPRSCRRPGAAGAGRAPAGPAGGWAAGAAGPEAAGGCGGGGRVSPSAAEAGAPWCEAAEEDAP